MPKRSGSIPKEWLQCPRKSDYFIANKFLAFKTPLDERYNRKMPLKCTFPPNMIFDHMKMLKMDLGLWIDLTNTTRYYNREEVESKGCRYVKMQCQGHGLFPSDDQTRAFIEMVDEFRNERPADIIGVHCTHGFNRTGFFIVSYMVERLDYSVKAALSSFAYSRPPGIYRENYVQELYRRYDEKMVSRRSPERGTRFNTQKRINVEPIKSNRNDIKRPRLSGEHSSQNATTPTKTKPKRKRPHNRR